MDARYNSHAYSSGPSVGLAQLNLSIRRGCQRILPLFSLSNTPAPTPPLSPLPLSLPSPTPCPPPAPASTKRVPIPLPWGSSFAARAAHELPTASSIWVFLASVATIFSSSMSADARGRSGSRSRRDGRFPRAEAAMTRPRTRAWQPIYAAPMMEMLLASPRSPSRIGRWACRRASCPW